MEKWLKETYYNPAHPAGLSGVSKLYKFAKKAYPAITLKQVKEFLQKQDVYTVFREARYKFKRNITPVHKIDYAWQIDSLYMLNYADNNDMYKYVCCVIDVFSRYAWVRPLKTLRSEESARALADIFESGRQPTFSIRSDFGSEYKGKPFQNLLEKEEIKHFITSGELKASLIERFNLTLKKRLIQTMYVRSQPRWIDYLQECCEGYNKSPHTSLGGLSPNEVNKDNEDEVRLTQYLVRENRKRKKNTGSQRDIKKEIKLENGGNLKSKSNKIKVRKVNKPRIKYKAGQLVRLSHLRSKFTRAYDEQFTEELFKIVKGYIRDGVVVYKIQDYNDDPIKGTFYQPELQPVIEEKNKLYRIDKIIKEKGRGKNKQYFVSYRGWPSKFNSWVKERAVKELLKAKKGRGMKNAASK